MRAIDSVEELESIYGPAVPGAVKKVVHQFTPEYRQWVEAARFMVLSTVGPEGTDGSPRGDDGPVVRVVDDHTIWFPDWRGNKRVDSLRNIVRDGRVSLMFMVPGSNNVVRVNGTAMLTDDEDARASFAKGEKEPQTVVVVRLDEMYFQCAKALMRSKLWSFGDQSGAVPTAGDFLAARLDDFDGAEYDAGYPDYAKDRLWTDPM